MSGRGHPAMPAPCPRCTGLGDAHYLTCPALRHERPQMCTADDLTGGEPCLRAARWVWQPDPADHPAFLCNFHAEPLITPVLTVPLGGLT